MGSIAPVRRPSLGEVLPVAGMIGAAFMCSVIVTPLYPLYEKRFQFSPLVLTLIYATYALGNLVALLLFGQLSDQLGRKRVARPGLGLAALSAAAFLFAAGPVWLFVARLLSGVAVGLLSSIGTAWLAEQYGAERRATATLMAAVANLAGIALGPLLGGVLAQYAPAPLRVPLIAYLIVLAAVTAVLLRVPDRRGRTVASVRELDLRPSVGLPREKIGAFVPAAIAAFASFALAGFYFALLPNIVQRELQVANVAVAGYLVCAFGGFAVAFIIIGRTLTPVRAMVLGLLLVLPALALVAVAQGLRSMAVLTAASAVSGIALAFGYRGSLQVVNEIAPHEKRGRLVSSYLIACFLGNSVPVIGIGLLTTLTSPIIATVVFAVTLAVLAIVALLVLRVQSRA
jgi:MFS family permease